MHQASERNKGTASNRPTPTQVRDQLRRIEEAYDFRASARIRTLLNHLVESTLQGREEELSQRHLAEDVFARTEAFDPEQDAIVRVEMRRLRQALDGYYAGSGRNDPVLITVPKGTYVPEFARHAQASLTSHAPIPIGIAVLPFTDCSEKADNDWMVRGIDEELTTLLGRIPELVLVPRHSLPEGSDQLRQVAADRERFPFRYVLEGTTRHSSERVRTTARLHDLENGQLIWCGRYDRDIDRDKLLEIQEDIARHVVGHAADMTTGSLGQSLRHEISSGTASHDATLTAQILFHTYLHETSNRAYAAAREAVEAAFGREPKNPLLLSMLADLRRAGYALGFTDEPDCISDVRGLLKQALALEPDCLPCRISQCFALLHSRQMAELHKEIDAILQDPTAPTSYHTDVAVPLALSGEWERGCELLDRLAGQYRLRPHYYQYPQLLRTFRDGDFPAAARLADGLENTGFFWRPLLTAAVFGKLGQTDAARQHLAEVRALRPRIDELASRTLGAYIADEPLIDDLLDGLSRSGLRT